MTGGWEGSNRRNELPADWPKIRAQVKKRAHGRCEEILYGSGRQCPRFGTDADHIADPEDHGLANLRWLCPYHHGSKSSWQGNQERRDKASRRFRPPEPHPGLR